MNEALTKYLTQSYSRDVLRKQTTVEMPADPNAIGAAKAELARINALGLGASLAQRDFVSYQSKVALEKFLERVEGGSDASQAGTSGSPPGDAQVQGGQAPQRLQDRPAGNEPQASDSDQPQRSGTEQKT